MTKFARQTLKDKFNIEGPGLHSGDPVSVTVHPGQHGINFRRGADKWPATTDHARAGDHCTVVGGVAVVEHLMSAFAALGLTDAEVEVSGSELPAANGCSLEYCDAIKAMGLTKVGDATLDGPFERVFHIEAEIEIAIASGDGHWRYEFEGGDRWPHSQHFECFISDYLTEVAPARTFAFQKEYDAARAQRMKLGLGLQEGDGVLIGEEGYTTETRFDDEPARHKMLDLIGDLYLSGVPPQFLNVVAQRSGHRTNIEAAKRLRAHTTIE